MEPIKSKISLCTALFILLGTAGTAPLFSQSKVAKSVDEIKGIIKRSQSDDSKVSNRADDELSELTAESISNLFEIVKKGRPCDAVVAGQAISELNPNYPGLVPSVTKLVQGMNVSTLFHLKEEMWCRRKAAYLLPSSAEGLKSILDLLKNGDTWEKQTAVFALDDFTEVAAYNERAGEIEVMKEIIPALAKLQSSKDKTVSVMSTEVLGQISGQPPTELAELAKKVVVR